MKTGAIASVFYARIPERRHTAEGRYPAEPLARPAPQEISARFARSFCYTSSATQVFTSFTLGPALPRDDENLESFYNYVIFVIGL